MSSLYVAQIWFFNKLCVCRIFNAVYIVNITCSVELWHEQSITIPEFSFYKRTIKLLESKRTKLVFYRLKELNIWVCAARNNTCRWNCNVITTECTVFPVTRSKHFWCNFTNFITCNTSALKSIANCFKTTLKFVEYSLALNHLEWRICGTALFSKAVHSRNFCSTQIIFVQKTISCSTGFFYKVHSCLNAFRKSCTSVFNLLFCIHFKNTVFYKRTKSRTNVLLLKTNTCRNFWHCVGTLILKEVYHALFYSTCFCKSTAHLCNFKKCMWCTADFFKKFLSRKP